MMWESEKNDPATNKIAGEIQLRNYGKFLEDYSAKLQIIEDTLDESINSAWDLSVDPVSIQSSPIELCSLVQLIDTDNKLLNKVLIALAVTCAEIQSLNNEAKAKYFNAILFYGEGGSEEDAALSVSRLLPVLQNLSCFIPRCEHVLLVASRQLDSIHSNIKGNDALFPKLDVHFQVVLEQVGDLLVTLLTLDELLQNHTLLKDHWSFYKRTLKAVSIDLVNFSVNNYQLHSLDQAVKELEQNLLTGNIVHHALLGFKNVAIGSGLSEQLAKYIRACSVELETDLDPQILLVRMSALFLLHSTLTGNTDKKLFRLIWEPYKKIAAVTLVGNVVWHPEEFLLSHLPQLSQVLDKKAKGFITSSRLYYLQQKSQSLPKDTQYYYFQVCSWLLQMDTCMKQDSTHLKLEHLQMRCAIFLQGLDYAISISRLVKSVTNLHVSLAQPMTRTSVVALCRLVELLKCIQFMYHAHSIAVTESLNHVIQHLTFQALGIILNVKKNVASDRKFTSNSTRLGVLPSLLLLEKAFHGPGTKERRLVAHLALSTANQMKAFREEELQNLKLILRRLDTICELQSRLKIACDCSFLYWHRVILPMYLAHLFECRTDLHRVKYIFTAMSDCVSAMNSSKHTISPQVLKDNLQTELFEAFKSQILEPLCHQIETDLRLHVHSHLQLDERNPLRGDTNNYAPLLKAHPLRFFQQYISVKAYVENYLNQTFYNLTTVALHDWKTYGEMRCLAKQKYDLNTVEDNLPSQTLEQGLDVLEIMRNIHVFVSKYLYNLNNQIFIEHSSSNKHLNTINIRHIANSIRTHGTGIMNTTVNFTYQFLKRKFYILSQFLYDEQIKSRLIKDLKYFRETKAQTDQKYSYERADKFNRGIRKLGLSPDKLTYLDQFRILVSHIGNAMGYVRMIRSGGLHCCSNAICFIPDLEDIVSFQELCQEQGFPPSCIGSAAELDHILKTLARNFDEGTEYFRRLVDVFAPVCKDPKNVHLRNFHAIVPPLAINFVEHSITSKDKMTKKNKIGAAFTDDGFAMGVAYILKMLDLDSEFDSLHWFQSVRDKYSKEKAELLEQKTHTSRGDEKLQPTMTLTARRLDIYQQEFELLYYSLSSARNFFQKHSQPKSQEDKKL